MRDVVERDVPPCRGLDRRAGGQDAVVLQDHALVRAALGLGQRLRDAIALAGVDHHAGEVVEQRVVLVEHAGVLGQRRQRAAQRRPGLAVGRVRVGGGHQVGMGLVDRRVDREGGLVERALADHGFAAGVHEQQVRDLDAREMHAERIDPEMVGQLGIARGDVPGQAQRETVPREQAERAGQALLAMAALGRDARARRRRIEPEFLLRSRIDRETGRRAGLQRQDGGHDRLFGCGGRGAASGPAAGARAVTAVAAAGASWPGFGEAARAVRAACLLALSSRLRIESNRR